MLDRRKIIGAALEMADGEGLEAISMRRLAHRLGSGTMSLYHYVPNKGDLLEGMVDLVFEKVEAPPEGLKGWEDRIVYVSLSFRQAAFSHPSVIRLVASGAVSEPVVLQSTEAYLEAISRSGFAPKEAARVYKSTASYIIGHLSLELGGYFDSIVESSRLGGGPGQASVCVSPKWFPTSSPKLRRVSSRPGCGGCSQASGKTSPGQP